MHGAMGVHAWPLPGRVGPGLDGEKRAFSRAGVPGFLTGIL